MNFNKQDALSRIGSSSTDPRKVLADKKAHIAAIPFKDPRGQRTVTISNANAWDIYVCIMNNVQNAGQYALLKTAKADGTVVDLEPISANGVTYDTSHSGGIAGFRDAAQRHELGFVGIAMDCGEDDFVDQYLPKYKYAYISDSLDGPVSFPLTTKVNQAKSVNNQELQIRNVKFAGVLNASNDIVFILKAGRTLALTFDVAHVKNETR
jgi:hypothetical protein